MVFSHVGDSLNFLLYFYHEMINKQILTHNLALRCIVPLSSHKFCAVLCNVETEIEPYTPFTKTRLKQSYLKYDQKLCRVKTFFDAILALFA